MCGSLAARGPSQVCLHSEVRCATIYWANMAPVRCLASACNLLTLRLSTYWLGFIPRLWIFPSSSSSPSSSAPAATTWVERRGGGKSVLQGDDGSVIKGRESKTQPSPSSSSFSTFLLLRLHPFIRLVLLRPFRRCFCSCSCFPMPRLLLVPPLPFLLLHASVTGVSASFYFLWWWRR